MSEKHSKKFSTSLATREIQIKDTLRFHLIHVRKAIISHTNDSSFRQGEEVRGQSFLCCQECKCYCETQHGGSLENLSSIYLHSSTLGIFSKDMPSCHKDTFFTLITVTIHNIQNLEKPKCLSSGRRMNKQNVIHLCNEILNNC